MNVKLSRTNNRNGTSLQGYVTISYAQLVDKLGEPHMTDGDKITAEWSFSAEGVVFTIYDYKNDTPKGMYKWHIGGNGELAVAIVKAVFPTFHVEVY